MAGAPVSNVNLPQDQTIHILFKRELPSAWLRDRVDTGRIGIAEARRLPGACWIDRGGRTVTRGGMATIAVATLLAGPAAAGRGDAPMGGLPVRVTHGGAMDGLIDLSPLAKAEVALRALPMVADIAIEPGGWRIATVPGTAPDAVVTLCATLRANGLPRGVRVTVVPGNGAPARFLCRPRART